MIKWIKARWKPYLMILLAVQLFVYFKGCASSFLLYPSTDHHNAMGATSRPVETENGRLEVWAFRTKACRDAEPLAYVLSFCGNGSRAEDMAWWTAERWRNRPVEVWSLNYPGYGGSEGAAALNKIPPAALATYDSLKAVAGDAMLVTTEKDFVRLTTSQREGIRVLKLSATFDEPAVITGLLDSIAPRP